MLTRVAVTGGAGRIGRAVVGLLGQKGTTVVAIDSVAPESVVLGPENADDHVVWAQADVTDYASVVAALDGCDGLVHLAAIARPGVQADSVVHANNVVGSYNVLRAAAEVGIGQISQASSINAIGGAWSRSPRYDYFPLDEEHPTYAEDPYSLSKWICEQQADSIARRYDSLRIASFRFHMVVPERDRAVAAYGGAPDDVAVKNLWGYTSLAAAAGACWLGLEANLSGHEAFYIVASDTAGGASSQELARKHYPAVPVRRPLAGEESFFDCAKAREILGWRHQDW
jgi:nucleoside-diphosphate-sugar epimerase